MKDFGTLEYVLDTYSKNWTWKLTGLRAVSMVSRVIPQAWYGDGPDEAIVPDTEQNVQKKKSRNWRIVQDGNPSSVLIRTGKCQDLGKYDLYIINYDLLHKRLEDLSKLNIKTLVCDEVQHLRSKSTKKYEAVKKLAALESVKYRIGLSGTPIYNRGSEIWPIVDILRPGLLGTFDEFCQYFCYVNEKGKAVVLENKRASLGEELRKHVMLRRKKSDVLKELKEKVRYKEFIDSDINYYYGELDKIWKKLEEE